MKSVLNLLLIGVLAALPAVARAGDCHSTAACPATDVNCDNITDGFDIAVVRNTANWLKATAEADEPRSDVNGDGIVDGFDIAAIRNTACWLRSGVAVAELAGNSLDEYPYFEYVRAFNEDATVEIAIDPTRFPGVVGETCDIYIVEAKTQAEWAADASLTDVTDGGAQTETFGGATVQENTFTVTAAFELSADAGLGLGVGYDVVLDCDQNGLLSGADYIDGYGDEAGLYAIHDTTAAGPLAVTELPTYSVGAVFSIPAGYTMEDTYYPSGIAVMGELPLIVISHGNGHDYRWYDHIGNHMASYGYVVMSHQNNTGPGIETASTTTLGHTDAFLDQLDLIGGGVLEGHIDSSRIVWIGHSRGAEGIVRAYDRIYDGIWSPTHYDIADIVLLSSMLPVDFLGTAQSNPHEANYHLWTASADGDVSGGPGGDTGQTFHLHDRATRYRHSTVVQGAGHGDFHDGGGDSVASGPCLIGRPATHLIEKGYFLPLIKHYTEGNIPAMDFFWRQWESFKPIGAPEPGFCPESGGPAIVVNNTYHNGDETGNFVIDNFQTETSPTVSSSGGTVSYTVTNLTEDRLDDNNASFTWVETDPMNGMTYGRVSDTTRGVVFDYNGADLYYEQGIIPAQRDFTNDKYLSFRACQGTRHPYTIAELGDLTFTVTLRDGSGGSSSINIGAYGGGLEELYQRTGAGTGAGWGNEFETIRIRPTDFLANGADLDLGDVVAVRFDFGPSFGANEGRIGLDEIELTNDIIPAVTLPPTTPFTVVALVSDAPRYITPGDLVTLLVRVTAIDESYVSGSAMMHYRYDGGVFETLPLSPLGDGWFEVTLPAPECGDLPEYYFSAAASTSGTVTDPVDAPASFYSAEVGNFVSFHENTLDTNPGWTTEGLWAYGMPTGGGGAFGGPDPTAGHTGPNVYGYNLAGDYEASMVERHLTTTTTIDCTGKNGVQLAFWRWLGVEQPAYDHAYVRVSTDGLNWHTVWENETEIADVAWVRQQIDISDYADDQPAVYLRWTMGVSDSAWEFCGWNIDDISMLSLTCE